MKSQLVGCDACATTVSVNLKRQAQAVSILNLKPYIELEL